MDPAIEHLHNQLIMGIFFNIGRDPPEPGVAPFVSANDKPVVLSKPISGDAAEQRLKAEVMQLPARDRRRLKDVHEVCGNQQEYRNPGANAFSSPMSQILYLLPSPNTKPQSNSKYPPTPVLAARQVSSRMPFPFPSASHQSLLTLHSDWDLEIRKRYTQPLAIETGEFPDADIVQARIVPLCYEESLPHGCSAGCAGFMATATEQYIKEILSSVFNRTRSNIPGGSVNSVLRHHFKRQLQREEDSLLRGEISKVSGTGLLPVEAREASTRHPLAVHDLKLALRVADVGLGQFPTALAKVTNGYEEGEYEALQERKERESLLNRKRRTKGGLRLPSSNATGARRNLDVDGDVQMNGVNGMAEASPSHHKGADDEDWGWEGGSSPSRLMLAGALEDCLTMDF